MSAFGGYARYYDLLYHDKDYRRESEFVAQLIKKHSPGARRLLELGCGTGIHGILLAEQGYEIHGLDLSDACWRWPRNASPNYRIHSPSASISFTAMHVTSKPMDSST
jgi:predicted TPR repeat methyltransferase